jgi:hypothetical protein
VIWALIFGTVAWAVSRTVGRAAAFLVAGAGALIMWVAPKVTVGGVESAARDLCLAVAGVCLAALVVLLWTLRGHWAPMLRAAWWAFAGGMARGEEDADRMVTYAVSHTRLAARRATGMLRLFVVRHSHRRPVGEAVAPAVLPCDQLARATASRGAASAGTVLGGSLGGLDDGGDPGIGRPVDLGRAATWERIDGLAARLTRQDGVRQ